MMMYDLQDNSMAQEDDMIEERFTVAARNTVTPNKLYFLGLTTISCLYSSEPRKPWEDTANETNDELLIR